MKYFVELIKTSIEKGREIISKNECKTLAQARTALNEITLSENQTKRIHKCFHDEDKNKPCEIING
jgi:hypothetical protein